MANNKISKKEAIAELWRRGNLSWLLDANQKSLYELFHTSPHKTQVWLLSRRSGKSFSLCVLALEIAIKKKNAIIKFLSPTKTQCNMNVRPLMRTILETCPNDVMPKFNEKDYIFYFPNGSEIQLAGSENQHAEKLRGSNADLAIIDEAGDVTDLSYNVKSILLPATLTTKGKILIAGTPPKTEDHDFITFIEEGEARGSLIKRTVFDNPRLNKEDVEELIRELGGHKAEATRRELFCEIIKSEKTSVIPEFTEELRQKIIRPWPMPPHFDSYVAMDLGGKNDLTAVLFGYYDFKKDRVVIQRELSYSGKEMRLDKVIDDIKTAEEELWTNELTNEVKLPSIRVSDINYIVINEFNRISGGRVSFVATKKDEKRAGVNMLRTMLDSEKIIIDPSCKSLIRHLANVRWSGRTNEWSFGRGADDSHFDFVDALIYFIRVVAYTKNPYPAMYGYDQRDLYVNNAEKFKSNNRNTDALKAIFNIRGKNGSR